jgi:hypothetical protein
MSSTDFSIPDFQSCYDAAIFSRIPIRASREASWAAAFSRASRHRSCWVFRSANLRSYWSSTLPSLVSSFSSRSSNYSFIPVESSSNLLISAMMALVSILMAERDDS